MGRKRTGTIGLEITIPKMGWEQIDGDMDPSAHGGTLATGDGRTLELLKIQPVRDYVGEREAKEVGYPFWTREAAFDIDDLDPNKAEVQSALQSIGDEDFLNDLTPTQRALTIASALLDYGHADEGPSGWSKDIISDDTKVKWWSGKVAGAEYLADEDDAFRDDVLGWGDIKRALEEVTEEVADESAAQAWSTVGDQMEYDLEQDGFDPKSIVVAAEFGNATAVNGDITDKTIAGIESELEGYEYIQKAGGRVPGQEDFANAETVIDRVVDRVDADRETVEEAAKSLDWWQDEIPHGTSGRTYVWAKRKATGAQERRTTRRR